MNKERTTETPGAAHHFNLGGSVSDGANSEGSGMVSQQEQVTEEIRFDGSPGERALAARVFGLLRARGRFMAGDAPIRVSLESVGEFVGGQDGEDLSTVVSRLEAMVAANPGVFRIETADELRLLVTTRAGRAPVAPGDGSRHSFARRFMTPEPKPERPAQPVRERPRVDPSWATLPAVLDDLGFEEDEAEAADVPVAPAAAAPVLTPAEPVVAPAPVPAPLETAPTEVAAPAVEVDRIVPEAADDAIAVAPAPTPEPVPTPAPAPAPATIPAPARTITLPITAPTDVTGVDDLEVAAAIAQRLQADPRVANFGEQWLMEDRVPRFSRGDLRRFKDYLQEQEQPSTDIDLAQDVLSARPGSADFELVRFAINFRLQREHREFEFVGTANQRFWSTTGLPQIGTTRRKPNEIGTDYRFLLEEAPEQSAPRSAVSVDHVLTFYEYLHGLLPFDAEMQALLPAPLTPNQRAAVLTFECPQVYTTYLVELRFPTPNRGGFILGLDDFYTENLVPGAVLSISQTENDGHYRVEYLPESGQSARLLELDERRAPRYVFRPTSYACGVEPGMLLSEERFGNLNGDKPLDEKIRRRPEAVVAATFERIGVSRDGNHSADFATLLAGVNIERPISAALLRSILENDDTGAFSRDPEGTDVYTYVPGSTP